MAKKVIVYSKDYCPYCKRAKALLTQKGVNFTNIEIGNNAKLTQEMVEKADGRRTVPQIFIDNIHIGGSDDLFALERAGLLDDMLGLEAA